MPASSQRQFLVSVSGVSGLFDTKSGGETSADTTKHYDGGSTQPEVLSAPAETDNITISRAWKYERDYEIHKLLRARVGRYRATLSVTPTNEDLIAIAKPTTYPNALLVRVSEPDYDSGSSDIATWELEFAIGSVA